MSELSERLRRWWYQDGECMMAKDMREAANEIERLLAIEQRAKDLMRGGLPIQMFGTAKFILEGKFERKIRKFLSDDQKKLEGEAT